MESFTRYSGWYFDVRVEFNELMITSLTAILFLELTLTRIYNETGVYRLMLFRKRTTSSSNFGGIHRPIGT